jgi:hypothetical protein
MSTFIGFDGKADILGGTVRLRADGDQGFLVFAGDDIRLEGGQVLVRQGAIALDLQEPDRGDVSDRPRAEALRDVCPDGITCCIGLVHVCCQDFRVIGTCSGVWGCTRTPFIP